MAEGVRSVRDLPWNHDFALTSTYMVFVLDPILPNILKVVLARDSFIDSLEFKPDKGTRFLLVPRSGGRPRIVEHEALLHVHLTNAYDDGDDVVVELNRNGVIDAVVPLRRRSYAPVNPKPGGTIRW